MSSAMLSKACCGLYLVCYNEILCSVDALVIVYVSNVQRRQLLGSE